jgi:hypothetical protein
MARGMGLQCIDTMVPLALERLRCHVRKEERNIRYHCQWKKRTLATAKSARYPPLATGEHVPFDHRTTVLIWACMCTRI